jgi:two-component system chemotaxis response regulator CheB
VICSSLTEKGSETPSRALEKGAVEIITKPKMGTKLFFEESAVYICDVVKSAAPRTSNAAPTPPRLPRR